MIWGSAHGLMQGGMLRLGGIVLASACGMSLLGVVSRGTIKIVMPVDPIGGPPPEGPGAIDRRPPVQTRQFETVSDRPWRRKTPVFGILQRYILGEIFRSFLLALTAITGIFVLFMVMAQATNAGLSPRDILRLIPFVVPTSLPYTVPVALLFAVTVVFGRIAADNEVVAIKTAGLSAMAVLKPAYAFGLALSVLLFFLSGGLIPKANNYAKKVVFENFEDLIYKTLKKDRELNNGFPFYIKVRDVVGKTLIEPTFKRRAPKLGPNSYDAIVQAATAEIQFDLDAHVAKVYLNGSTIQTTGTSQVVALVHDKILEIPMPGDNKMLQDKKVQEMTTSELKVRYAENKVKIATERQRQAIESAMSIGAGMFQKVNWASVQKVFIDYNYWEQECNKVETERQLRTALAAGSIFFVMLGAPMGIRAARGDFLSAFIACFVPIIMIYYPLTLFGVNLGKEGVMTPWVALWVGNLVLAVLALLVIRPVLKH
ncbi:LptF/LptG family permease [Isosphaeraceae bacterium EP7]